ncbi:hypothetical protein F5051DRAFT_479105 [Lentinula edodes]|nr:hypothetical protein F5051DRAFT_479105 [Lentinula edodes]
MPLQVFGWTPSTDSTITKEFDLYRRSNTKSWAASPLSSSPSEEDPDPDADDDDRPRRGDPNWVARPRNAFIIFRCHYSKQNARNTGVGGKRGLPPVDKTMSKRAGDAWKSLSKSRKNYYKQLADQEKKVHALAHPGYRYRPKKRTSSSRRRGHGGNPVSRASQSADSRLESSNAVSDDDDYVPPVAQVSQPVVESSPRFLKRRSISVPLLPPLLLTPQERLGMRRTSKSGVLTLPSSPLSSPGSSISTFELLYPEYPDHDSALGFGSLSLTLEPKLSATPPLATVSSSLAGWNGLVVPQMNQTVSTSPMSESSSAPPGWAVTPPTEVNCHMYNPEGYASTMTPASYWSPGVVVESAALHNYNIGLMDQSTPEDYLMFDTPVAEEQQIFEGFCHF